MNLGQVLSRVGRTLGLADGTFDSVLRSHPDAARILRELGTGLREVDELAAADYQALSALRRNVATVSGQRAIGTFDTVLVDALTDSGLGGAQIRAVMSNIEGTPQYVRRLAAEGASPPPPPRPARVARQTRAPEEAPARVVDEAVDAAPSPALIRQRSIDAGGQLDEVFRGVTTSGRLTNGAQETIARTLGELRQTLGVTRGRGAPVPYTQMSAEDAIAALRNGDPPTQAMVDAIEQTAMAVQLGRRVTPIRGLAGDIPGRLSGIFRWAGNLGGQRTPDPVGTIPLGRGYTSYTPDEARRIFAAADRPGVIDDIGLAPIPRPLLYATAGAGVFMLGVPMISTQLPNGPPQDLQYRGEAQLTISTRGMDGVSDGWAVVQGGLNWVVPDLGPLNDGIEGNGFVHMSAANYSINPGALIRDAASIVGIPMGGGDTRAEIDYPAMSQILANNYGIPLPQVSDADGGMDQAYRIQASQFLLLTAFDNGQRGISFVPPSHWVNADPDGAGGQTAEGVAQSMTYQEFLTARAIRSVAPPNYRDPSLNLDAIMSDVGPLTPAEADILSASIPDTHPARVVLGGEASQGDVMAYYLRLENADYRRDFERRQELGIEHLTGIEIRVNGLLDNVQGAAAQQGAEELRRDANMAGIADRTSGGQLSEPAVSGRISMLVADGYNLDGTATANIRSAWQESAGDPQAFRRLLESGDHDNDASTSPVDLGLGTGGDKSRAINMLVQGSW